ncbi:hypothetical protein PROFUN_01741 [Planoprotostelium fungivorum]|uniref:Uncharacterized protein n=1 Tax=Planoprotostelium fungivorum TaxID=1890364 RepID=A0A2P6MWE8_9EUKA|nr:hypothetical protein PROFUN_01741 [Planoprotostelium fungivorum]
MQQLQSQNRGRVHPAVRGPERIRLPVAADLTKSQHARDSDINNSLRAEMQKLRRKHEKQTVLLSKKCQQAKDLAMELHQCRDSLEKVAPEYDPKIDLLKDQKQENARLVQLCMDLQNKIEILEGKLLKSEESLLSSVVEHQEKQESLQDLINEMIWNRTTHTRDEFTPDNDGTIPGCVASDENA